MSNFWTVRFLKTESEPNFGFPHIPTCNKCYVASCMDELFKAIDVCNILDFVKETHFYNML